MFLDLMKFRSVDHVLALGNRQITDFRLRSPDAVRKRWLIVHQSPKNGSMLILPSPSFENMHDFPRIVSGAGCILDPKRICLVFATSIESVRGNGTNYARQLFDSGAQRAYPFDSQKREVPHTLTGQFSRSVPGGYVTHFVRYYACQFCLALRPKDERACDIDVAVGESAGIVVIIHEDFHDEAVPRVGLLRNPAGHAISVFQNRVVNYHWQVGLDFFGQFPAYALFFLL